MTNSAIGQLAGSSSWADAGPLSSFLLKGNSLAHMLDDRFRLIVRRSSRPSRHGNLEVLKFKWAYLAAFDGNAGAVLYPIAFHGTNAARIDLEIGAREGLADWGGVGVAGLELQVAALARQHRRGACSAGGMPLGDRAPAIRLYRGLLAPYPHELAQVSFAVAGDVIPHEPVRAAAAAAAGDGEAGWGSLLPMSATCFENADFGFVNLETPVAPAHSKDSKPFMFDAPWR